MASIASPHRFVNCEANPFAEIEQISGLIDPPRDEVSESDRAWWTRNSDSLRSDLASDGCEPGYPHVDPEVWMLSQAGYYASLDTDLGLLLSEAIHFVIGMWKASGRPMDFATVVDRAETLDRAG